MKSITLIATLCLVACAAWGIAQDVLDAPLPDVLRGPASNPNSQDKTPAADHPPTLANVADNTIELLRVEATLEGDETSLRKGQKVYFYQQAMFRGTEVTCQIADKTVDPCTINSVHRQKGNQIDLSLAVPAWLSQHVAGLSSDSGEKPVLFVRLVTDSPTRFVRRGSVDKQLKIFRLTHLTSADAHQLISQLFHDDLATLAVDKRSNALIVRGVDQRLQEIEAILLELDTPSARTAAVPGAPSGMSGLGGPAGLMPGMGGTMHPGSQGIGLPGPPHLPGMGAPAGGGSLRRRFQELNQRSVDLAAQLLGNTGNQNKETLTRELRTAVQEAFQARQQLQRAELAALQRRLQQVGESIKLRDRIAAQIVRRRVEDLLNPNMQWDQPVEAPPAPSARVGSTSKPNDAQSFANEVEATVAREEQRMADLQGKWMLARTAKDAEPRTIVIEGSAWHFFDPDQKEVRTSNRALVYPPQDDKSPPRIIVEFRPSDSMRAVWMGTFKLDGDELALHFSSANMKGFRSRDDAQDVEERMRDWSGLFRRVNSATTDASATSQDPRLAQIRTAVQPVLTVLRGEDSQESRLAQTYFDDEWEDDIEHIAECQGSKSLTIDRAWADDTSAFLVTSQVTDDRGTQWIMEFFLQRQDDGKWKVVMADDEPADHVKRDVDKYLEEYPDAKAIQFSDAPAGPAKVRQQRRLRTAR